MKLEHIVQIHIALLAIIGALLLGLAQGDMLLPMLVIFAAVTSVIFTDVLNWLRLNRVLANMAALVALFVCLSDFVEAGLRSRLLAVASLLVYLQIVLFYQRKNPRLYWQLTVLSLLQVVVSAALNVPMQFGLLLILYAAVAISTLTFFFVHREIVRVAAFSRGGGRRPPETMPPSAAGPPWRRLLDARPKVSMLLGGRRLAAQITEGGLSYQVAVMGATTLVFTLVLFFSAPRLDSATRRVQRPSQPVVGFSSEVRLDELRNVLQSDETVMRLVFRDHHTDSPYSISGVPYIRGSVLSDYYVAEGGHSGWKQRSSWVAQSPEELQDEISALMPGEAIPLEIAKRTRLLQAPRHDFLVRQEAILEPLDEAVLFAVHPVFAFDGTSDDVAMDLQSERLYSQRQRDGSMRHEYRYALLTTALRGGLQLEVTPHAIRRRMMWNDFYVDQEKRRLLEFDAQRFPQLKAIADEIAQRPRAAGSPTATLARALRDHFLVPGRYVYSLDFSTIPRDRRLDPIEDFVANHRTGHCEYYASALAMMLRSQGIPARLVIGFHCDEYNAVGGYYQVRQRHAHAWVEAFLEPEEVTEELPSGSDTSPYGGWLRLDATPGFDVDRAVQVRQGIIERIDDVLDYAQLLWSDYILGLTATRQRETIYDPVTERADPETWSNWMDDLAERRRDILRWVQDYLLRPSTLAALTLTALLLSVWWVKAASRRPGLPPVVQRVSRWTARLTGQNPDAAGRAMLAQHIGFYRRFERLLARLGLSRTAGQTQREFATEAAVRLRDISETPDPLGFTTRLVQAFYRVRFGRELLDAAEKETLDNGLTALERHLAEHPNGRPDRERSDV